VAHRRGAAAASRGRFPRARRPARWRVQPHRGKAGSAV